MYGKVFNIKYIALNHGELAMFATLFFGILDLDTGKLSYINGGHETVFVIDRSGIKERLSPTGPAVGLIPQAIFEFKQVQLQPGEVRGCVGCHENRNATPAPHHLLRPLLTIVPSG